MSSNTSTVLYKHRQLSSSKIFYHPKHKISILLSINCFLSLLVTSSLLVLCNFAHSRYFIEVESHSICPFVSGLFLLSILLSGFIHGVACIIRTLFHIMAEPYFLYDRPHFVYLFICRWMFAVTTCSSCEHYCLGALMYRYPVASFFVVLLGLYEDKISGPCGHSVFRFLRKLRAQFTEKKKKKNGNS
jgi:hypothetical protein